MLAKSTLVFLSVAEQGSFSKASRQLYLSPVAIMKQINLFEAEVGVQLFKRSKRGVTLTPAGEVLYQDAHQLQKQAQAALKRVRQLANQDPTIIRVGTSLLRSCEPLIHLWPQQTTQNAEFRIQIVPFTDDGLGLNQLLKMVGHQIDCFISPYDTIQLKRNFSIQKLGDYDCQIGVPTQNTLANKSALTWTDLDNQRLLLLKSGVSTTIDAIRQQLLQRRSTVALRNLNQFYDLSSFNQSVEQNSLIEVISPWATIHPNLKLLPMDWHYQIPYGLVYAKHPSPEIQKFVKLTAQLAAPTTEFDQL